MTTRREALVQRFRAVTGERLVKIHRLVGLFEANRHDVDVITELARELHSLKGEARLLGFGALGVVAHELEEQFTAARSAESPAPFLELILDGLGVIERIVILAPDDPASGEHADVFCTRARASRPASPTPPPTLPSRTTPPPRASPTVPPQQRRTIPPPMGAPMAPRTSETARPAGTTILPTQARTVTRNNGAPISEAQAIARDRKGVRVQLGRLEQLADAADELMISHEVRVSSDRAIGRIEAEARAALRILEQLLAKRGPMLAGTPKFAAIAAELESLRNRQQIVVRELHDIARRITVSTDEDRERLTAFEDLVRDLRLVVLERLFEHYPRAARDLAREQGKQVQLEIVGGNVEIDHEILERLEDPLLHLIRNAIDHGIESPEERHALGKRVPAVLKLAATQHGSRVLVVLEDDGRGIEVERVLEVAKQRGLVDPSVSKLDMDAAADLLFASGFSTRDTASDLSGRGVGLDVVKARIEAMDGSIHIRSTPGRGTRFELSIPVSLVRAPALILRAGNMLFGISQASVERVLEARSIQRVNAGGAAIRVDEQLVRIASLDELLGFGTTQREGSAGGSGVIVVLVDGDRRLALEVDSVISDVHVIQRELGALVRENRITIATAVVGAGKLVCMLNAAELIRTNLAGALARPSEVSSGSRSALQQRNVLVVDDSDLTRDIMMNLVARAGFTAFEAVDGRAALDQLASRQVDLVVTDLEMPVLDGFGMLRELRATPQYKHLPVIVCSTRGSQEDKLRAAELGANAYIVKARFDEAEFVRTISRLLGAS